MDDVTMGATAGLTVGGAGVPRRSPVRRIGPTARQQLFLAGISPAGWARRHFPDGHWHGDECGCPDEVCGSNHDGSVCECLTARLAHAAAGRSPDEMAASLWARHGQAVEIGDPWAVRAINREIGQWVRRYHPAATSFSLSECVDGRAGITITAGPRRQRWLVWTPEPEPRHRTAP